MPSLWLLVGQSAHLSRVQNSRQLILVFGGIYSSKTWMASHARKLFTSFAQAHARASFAQARNHASRESEKPRKPSPKTASRLHRASKSARKLRISSSRKVAQAPFEKLTARKLASSHCGRARMAQGFRARMNNFHSVLIEVLNTAHLEQTQVIPPIVLTTQVPGNSRNHIVIAWFVLVTIRNLTMKEWAEIAMRCHQDMIGWW